METTVLENAVRDAVRKAEGRPVLPSLLVGDTRLPVELAQAVKTLSVKVTSPGGQVSVRPASGPWA